MAHILEDLQHLSNPTFSHQGLGSSPHPSPRRPPRGPPVASAPCTLASTLWNSPIASPSDPPFLNSSKSPRCWQQCEGSDRKCSPLPPGDGSTYIPASHSVVNRCSASSSPWRVGSQRAVWTFLPPGSSLVKWSLCQLQDSRITSYHRLYNENWRLHLRPDLVLLPSLFFFFVFLPVTPYN